MDINEKENFIFDPLNLDQTFADEIDSAYACFDRGNSEIAARKLLDIYRNEENPYHLYLIHCYQSEILYYNNLPDQGFIITNLILEYANKINDDLLRASGYNFLGLHAINQKNYQKALVHFHKAKSLYPVPKTYPKLVDYFQILSNLAEAHLKGGDLDSAIHYIKLSDEYIFHKKNNRGKAINLWTLGIANFQKGNYTDALNYFQKASTIVNKETNADIYHHVLYGLISLYSAKADYQTAEQYIQEGLDSVLMNKSTFIGKAEFLEAAINCYLKASKFKEASNLQSKLLDLERSFLKVEQKNSADLMSNFFQSFNELEFERKTQQIKDVELNLSRALTISLLILLLFSGVIFFFAIKQGKVKSHLSRIEYNNNMKLLEKQKEMDVYKARSNAINIERNRIARELHDDIGSSISSIQIYLTMVQEKGNQNLPEDVTKLIAKANKDAKEISENVSDLVWAIYSKNDNFENLVLKMKQLAFDLFTASDIEIEFDYPYSIKDLKLGLDERRNIYLIFKEIVNNALKHSNCTLFKVIIKQTSDGFIEFMFSDNGQGINDSEFSIGNGMQTLQARVRSLNSKLHFQTGKDEGTIFSFHYKPFEE